MELVRCTSPHISKNNSFLPMKAENALAAYQIQQCSATQGPNATSFHIATLLKVSLKRNTDGSHPGRLPLEPQLYGSTLDVPFSHPLPSPWTLKNNT